MATTRRGRAANDPERNSDDVTAALDELEVRFLLDPDTVFGPGGESDPKGPTAQPDPPKRR